MELLAHPRSKMIDDRGAEINDGFCYFLTHVNGVMFTLNRYLLILPVACLVRRLISLVVLQSGGIRIERERCSSPFTQSVNYKD